jgi:hypothetical protein
MEPYYNEDESKSYRVTRIKRNPNFENVLKYCKQFLPYKHNQLQHNALQEVSTLLPNLKKYKYFSFAYSQF